MIIKKKLIYWFIQFKYCNIVYSPGESALTFSLLYKNQEIGNGIAKQNNGIDPFYIVLF